MSRDLFISFANAFASLKGRKVKPGTSGPNPSCIFFWAVADMPPKVRPWNELGEGDDAVLVLALGQAVPPRQLDGRLVGPRCRC